MKKSSYQKLKEENKKLRQDIHVLVNEKSTFKAIELNMIYSRPVITPILFGSRQKPPFIGGGILDQVQTAKIIPNIIETSFGMVLRYPFLKRKGCDE